ncbi:FMN reductase [Aurantimicrobium minutum]|uniref:FMN reductase n=1 Tax=Aurantimicrobium minutum TaxID=708131 RepID=UPI002404D5BC|nr:FMN reductase [Aurantimicrobium minutum]MDF9809215.1 FMN reductase [Aurantimicrobium minutum]
MVNSKPLKVVAVSGSLHAPSKTTVLTQAILDQFGKQFDVIPQLIEISEIGGEFAGALNPDQLPDNIKKVLSDIENADVLIVASPVYRASFTGLFKHLFDFVSQYALVDKPVFLAATGGSERHALILEHQFRPLFAFFQAITLPIGIYGSDSDFSNYQISNPELTDRIALSVERSTPLIKQYVNETEALARYI